MFDNSHLYCGHLNIYHLQNKVPDLCVLLNQPSPFHLFGVTESRLSSNISDDCISIDGFSTIRRDAEHVGHTGITVYVHDSISPFTRRRKDLESETVESVWVEIKANKSAPLLVGYIYRNPSSNYQWYDDFTAMFDKINHCSSDVLLLGDFNLNMFSRNPAWECTTSMFGLKQLITSATRVSPSSSTLIDHIYTTNKSRIVGTYVPEVAISDHYPVCCNWALKTDTKFRKNKHTTIRYRSLKNFNKDAFLSDLSNASLNNVYNHTDPDAALAEWYSVFLSVLDRHAPFRTKRVKNVQFPAWLTKDIREAMSTRNEMKRQKNFEAYRKERNRVKYLVRQAQKAHFHRLMTDKKDITSVWRAINCFTKSKQTAKCTSLSAQAFNDHFLSAANSVLENNVSSTPCISEKLISYCNEKFPQTTSFSIPPLTVFDVGKSISSMKNKRSTGHDGISSTVLKLSLPYTVESLTYIYNLCIQHGFFPSALKVAKVVPLPKTKDLDDPNKFRPISLLSTISKPLEKHIHKHAQHFLEEYGLLHPLQSGFRPGHSCHTALTHMVDRWLNAINKSQMTGAVFLDLAKAFDTVNHSLLLQKMSAYHFSSSTVDFFNSYLDGRTQYVYVNGACSSEGIIEHGVPQGSILGPFLFSLFINDLPLHISNPNVTCSLFADDSTLDVSATDITTLNQSLQQALDEVSEWCCSNHMVSNPSKTKCMLITTRQRHQLNPPPLKLSLKSVAIEQVREHRVLGLIVDDQLCWQPHLYHLGKVLSKHLFLLSKLKHLADEPTRKLFYHAHIQPHLDYVSTIWDGASEANMKKLNSLHRRSAKLIIDKSRRHISTDEKLKKLGILPLCKQLSFNKAILMRKITLSKVPTYLTDLFVTSDVPYRTLRNELVVPKPRIDLFKASLSYSGAKLWNDLPKTIRTVASINTFKVQLLRHVK